MRVSYILRQVSGHLKNTLHSIRANLFENRFQCFRFYDALRSKGLTHSIVQLGSNNLNFSSLFEVTLHALLRWWVAWGNSCSRTPAAQRRITFQRKLTWRFPLTLRSLSGGAAATNIFCFRISTLFSRKSEPMHKAHLVLLFDTDIKSNRAKYMSTEMKNRRAPRETWVALRLALCEQIVQICRCTVFNETISVLQ